MVIKKTERTRPDWVTNLPRAYWQSLEEADKLPPEAPVAEHPTTQESKALDQFYAFQHRQENLRQKASHQQIHSASRRNALVQDANRRYTTMYDRRQSTDRRKPAASSEYNTNRRKSTDRRAAPQHISLFRRAGLRDSPMSEQEVYIPQPTMRLDDTRAIRIEGLAYEVSITDSHLRIGQAYLPLEHWEVISDNELLDNYGRKLLNFWRSHKDMLLGMAMEKAT